MHKMVLNRTEVAALFGISKYRFSKLRALMEAEGFPEQLPVTGGWSRAAVVAWINQQLPAANIPQDPAEPDLAAAIRSAA